jgi:two-component system nitrate/nitrite response regulator NarL
MESMTRVIVVGSYAMLRAGLGSLIRTQSDLSLVGEAGTKADAMPLLVRAQPDVVLLEVDGDLEDWSELLDAGAAGAASTRFVLLTHRRDTVTPVIAIERGARGVVNVEQPPDVLFKALRKVRQGEYWLDRSGFAAVLDRRRRREVSPEQERIRSLTRREREVVSLVGEGLKNRDVAERLHISEATVRNHLTSILDKLDVADRFELALFGLRHGLLPCPGCGRTHGALDAPPVG